MLSLLYLIPALPLAGFILLALGGRRMPKTVVAVVGAGSVGLSAVLAVMIAVGFIAAPPEGRVFVQTLWTWMEAGNFAPAFSFSLDALSLLMTLVITIVGFLIHLYSTEFMEDDEGYSRFFAYMNLFVGAMLTLVLADNLVFLYLGWEGVGLCSYLLIGFWYSDPANGRAARKAFIVTRAGDTAFAIGLFLLFTNLGTLDIRELLALAPRHWAPGSAMAVAAAALLLGGAVGKSAQLPLQVWLPDAMAGPTPVSALIHAATMVTAGVYLIARTHVLFTLAPAVQLLVAIIGAATLLIAGCSALAQRDIKRVLAYSTISQIGYMFLALGVGAWTAALFHFMTHAFFKALLFLGAGAIILAQRDEHDMFKMGGLKDRLPAVFRTFLIGSASLSALPLVTAGFYSKDLILWEAWSSPIGGLGLWLAGITGAFLTAAYTFRMVFVTFFGEQKIAIGKQPGRRIMVPLAALAAMSVAGGFVELPGTMGGFSLLSNFLKSALPLRENSGHPAAEFFFQVISSVVCIGGVIAAYVVYVKRPDYAEKFARSRTARSVRTFWYAGWDFDALYDRVFVRPFVWIVEVNRHDVIDLPYTGLAAVNRLLHAALARTQTGNIRWYAMGIAAGACAILGLVIYLN